MDWSHALMAVAAWVLCGVAFYVFHRLLRHFDELWPVAHLDEKASEKEFERLLRVDRKNKRFTITSTPHFRVVHTTSTENRNMMPLSIVISNIRIDSLGTVKVKYWTHFSKMECRMESGNLLLCRMDRVPLVSIYVRGEESSPIDIYARNGWSAKTLLERISHELFRPVEEEA
jgi:hypothetical protein